MSIYAAAHHVSKRFYATQALDKVSLNFKTGEVHALVGENGAGKSTLMKIFGGVHKPDSGQILINGSPTVFTSPRDALAAGVIVIPQEMQVVPRQTVTENILLARIPRSTRFGFLGGVDRRAMRQRASELMRRFHLDINPDTGVDKLGFAERQIVMIARALNHEARFLILDEPTAALETREVDRLFEVINQLKSLDVALAFVSHRLDEVEAISDVCTILRDGKKVEHEFGTVPDKTEMARLMTGRDLEEVHRGRARIVGDSLINIEHRTGATSQNIAVGKSEILGLAGLLGGGMTAFIRGTFGAEAETKPVTIGGFRLELSTPAEAIKQGFGMVPGERNQGLVMGMTVRENIILPNLDSFAHLYGLDKRAITTFVEQLIQAVDIRPPDPNKVVRDLSGGNQQKVIFARWLAGHINLLLLDEPTHGVDVGAKAQIHRIMNEFADNGGGIVFASSELTEVLSVSDNVLAMRSGEVVARISRDGDYNEKSLRNALDGQHQADKSGKVNERLE